MIGRPRSDCRRLGARGLALAAAAALLGCGVKAPPKPPEKAGVAGSKHDPSPAAGDGGAAGGETGAADGGAGPP